MSASGSAVGLAEEGAQLHRYDSEEGLTEDAGIHFRRAEHAVGEHYRHLTDAEAELMGSEFHLNLEGIAFEADVVEVNGPEHICFIADKTRRRVADRQSRDEAHIFRGEVAHQHSPHRPVNNVDSAFIAGAYGHVGTVFLNLFEQTDGVLRVMAEIAVHFEDMVVAPVEGPLESGNIGRTETELAGAVNHMDALRKERPARPHDIGRAVRRIVIDDEQVGSERERHHGVNHRRDVLLFVISRNDYEVFAHFEAE